MEDKIKNAPDKKTIVKKIHDALWYNKEFVEKPFEKDPNFVNDLILLVTEKPKIARELKNMKKDILRELDNKKQEGKRILKDIEKNSKLFDKKYKEKSSKNIDPEPNYNVKYITQKESTEYADDIYGTEQLDKAHIYLKWVSSMRTTVLITISCILKELNKMVKEYFRLYYSAGLYLRKIMKENIKNDPSKKKEYAEQDPFKQAFKKEWEKETKKDNEKRERKERRKRASNMESYMDDDIDYINAVVEAEIYESELQKERYIYGIRQYL